MTPWWLCFLLPAAAADRHDALSCRGARCPWRCDASFASFASAEIRCPVSSVGSQQNSFHSPRMASQQDRQRLRFRFKGDLELFALVSDSSDEWISLWKSHAQKAHPTHSSFTDANEDWAATVLLLPSLARALQFTGQGVLGDILADQQDGRRLGKTASWSPWTQVQFSYGPSKRRWHTAVLDAGKMWIFAGDDGELLNDLWYYDTVTLDGWVEAKKNGSWPSPRFSHMAVMQSQQMWVFGGVVQSGLSKELWSYDMELGTWSGWSNLEGPSARESMTLVEGDGKLWMFGGYDGSIRSDLWCLTTAGDPLWTLVSTGLAKPAGRYSHVAVQEAGKMWIFGGLTEVGLQADLWYLDISSLIWTEVDCTDGPSARESATAVSQPGEMWIYGGIDAKNQSDELWLLDLDANPAADASRWRSMVSGAGPSGRQYHVAVLDPEGRMWLHNGELWYYATRTSTSSSSSKTTSTTSQSTTLTSTTLTSTSSTSSSTTSSTSTSTTLTSTSSSSSTTQTSSTTSSSSSSSTSTTLSNTTTTSTTTSTSTETSTTSSTSRTTTSTSTTLSTTTSRTSTTSSTTSSSTTKTSTTTSTSKSSTSSSTTSQTSTTTSTSSSSSATTSTTRTESSTSTSVTKTSITTSWTFTSTSSMTSTWTIGNTTTVTFTSTTTQVKNLDAALTDFLISKVEEAKLTISNASQSAVTVIENSAPEAEFTMSMVSFKTHSSRVINESSLPLAVPSFSSSASQPLLASMSIKTLQLPGVDLPELGDGVETASGKVRVIAAPLLQIAVLDPEDELGEAETNLSGLLIFRASKEAVDPASCSFLTDEGWSDEGLHLASREEITQAFGDIDTSGTWCATSHLSVFALLRPCTFLETLQRDGKCFDTPSFGALIGSTCLCLCCSFCGVYTTVKSRHVVGGKMKLSDVEGSSHEVPFQVKRPKRDWEQFDGVADADSKTLVTWDVERPHSGAGTSAASGNQTLPIAQLMSPKKRLQLNLKTKFFSERSQVQLPRSGTILSMQSFPDAFEATPHREQPSASSHEVAGTYEIYEHREYIEFFSETHQTWTSGSIEGSGFLQPMDSDLLPSYDVRLNRQQIRRMIPLERIRPPFQPGDAVTVKVDDEWQAATVQRRQGYPLAYEVEVSSGKQVVPGEKLRARFSKGERIFAFRGMKTGWVQGIVHCESEETWPMILVTNQKDGQAMSIFQFLIRPSAKMEGFSS